MRNSVKSLLVAVVLLTIAILLSMAMTNLLVDEPGATKVLQENGYTYIKITGYRYFMKGQDDAYATGFEAISSSGHPVSGSVTRGLWYKGATIRFD